MAFNNYIEDDWDDNALTGRSASQKDVFYSFSDGGTGDLLKGVYRPYWNEIVTTDLNIQNGELEFTLNSNDGTESVNISTTTNLTVGEWSRDIKFASDSTDNSNNGNISDFLFISTDNNGRSSSNCLTMTVSNYSSNSNRWQLSKTDNGTTTELIGATPTPPTSYTTQRVTRDSYGNFELFRGGVSEGTTTDAFLPEPNYAIIACYDHEGSGVHIFMDNLLIK